MELPEWLYDKLHKEWLEKIQRGDCQHVEDQSNRVSVKKLEHEGKFFYVVYDRFRHTIVTVLTDEMARRNNYI
jgi:hypothetical protein